MLLMATFGERIKYLRLKNRMTQSELAERVNIERSAIAKWEAGRSIPSGEVLLVLSKIFGVSINYLMGTDDLSNISNI